MGNNISSPSGDRDWICSFSFKSYWNLEDFAFGTGIICDWSGPDGRALSGVRKVGAPQGRVPANGRARRRDGKCHRKEDSPALERGKS